MHNFMISFFDFLKSLWHFLKIVCVMCIILLLCYWVQNLTNAEWSWLGFITPFLNGLLNVANQIYSVSFNLFGAVFEFKYLSALIILVAVFYIMNLLIMLTNIAEGAYRSAHFICKKTEEVVMNTALKAHVEKEEKKINKYMILISTQLKPKFSHRELNINIDEQNKVMNKFIMEKTGAKAEFLDNGFLYRFNQFSEIDKVLDIIFKVLKSDTPLDYCICIQAGDDVNQLKKLASLKHFGKVSIAADTAYRYRFNETHRYQTSQVGIFQNGDSTLEVHEFKEIL